MKAMLQDGEWGERKLARVPTARRFKPIQAVARAAAVLKAFGEAQGELGIGELAGRVQLSPSTVYRLVATLCEAGLLEQNPSSGKYYPGLGLFILAQTAIPQRIIARASRAALEALVESIGEAASLGCLQGNRVVLLRHVDSAEVLRVDLQPGDTLPATSSALGRAILAHTAPDLVERDPALARERLAGYAMDRGGYIPGVAGLAAPIRDFQGAVVAALGVSGPMTRLTDGRLAEIQPQVVAAADLVSRRLGWDRQTYRDPPADEARRSRRQVPDRVGSTSNFDP